MRLIDWLSLAMALLLCMSAALFAKSSLPQKPNNYTFISALLGEKKRALSTACVGDLALVDGISLKKARLIKEAIDGDPHPNEEKLLAIKGVGPKTLEHLKLYFSF